MLVVDASCLYEVVSEGPLAESTRRVMESFEEMSAPALIDVEVVSLIRRDAGRSVLAPSRADIALAEMNDWCGERFPVRPFNDRVWQLRSNVRTWDAYYVALAEYLDAPLLTLDRRLESAQGPACRFVVPA